MDCVFFGTRLVIVVAELFLGFWGRLRQRQDGQSSSASLHLFTIHISGNRPQLTLGPPVVHPPPLLYCTVCIPPLEHTLNKRNMISRVPAAPGGAPRGDPVRVVWGMRGVRGTLLHSPPTQAMPGRENEGYFIRLLYTQATVCLVERTNEGYVLNSWIMHTY